MTLAASVAASAPPVFDAADWFWFVGADRTRAYGSKAKGFVAAAEVDPARAAAVPDEADLMGILERYGLPPSVPARVTRRQGLLALYAVGKLEAYRALVAGLTGAAAIEVEGMAEFERGHPLVVGLVGQLYPQAGEAELAAILDDLFRDAAQY